MRAISFGPAGVPSRESPAEAVEILVERDYTACEIDFSDIAYTKRTLVRGELRGGNEKYHLPYGEGTLRAEPLRDALARFERPATVISESPDEASSQTIRAILLDGRTAS